KDAGWSRNIPAWQKEKFSLIFTNSTWAFTVWDQNEMIGMVRVISDKIMAANIMDLVVLSNYRGRGIGKKLVQLCVGKLPHGDWFA
ncbi:GNAT family N-acetyltransferase, partial [Planococcus sp. SIMBA_143]